MPRKPRKKKETSEIVVEYTNKAESGPFVTETRQAPKPQEAEPRTPEPTPPLKEEINAILDTAPTMPINITVRDREEQFRPAYNEFLAKLRQAVK